MKTKLTDLLPKALDTVTTARTMAPTVAIRPTHGDEETAAVMSLEPISH